MPNTAVGARASYPESWPFYVLGKKPPHLSHKTKCQRPVLPTGVAGTCSVLGVSTLGLLNDNQSELVFGQPLW